jgi:hypothetical protein
MVVVVAIAAGGAAAGSGASARSAPTVVPRAFAHSYWARTSTGGGMRAAPSVFPASPLPPVAPQALADRVLDRLGDRRYVKRVVIGKVPPTTFQQLATWGRGRPPQDAVWAYLSAPAAHDAPSDPSGDAGFAWMLANWEADLVWGALRDAFCAAGGRPLVGFTLNGERTASEATFRSSSASTTRR